MGPCACVWLRHRACVWLCVCVFVCVCGCAFVCSFVWVRAVLLYAYTQTQTHTHIHTHTLNTNIAVLLLRCFDLYIALWARLGRAAHYRPLSPRWKTLSNGHRQRLRDGTLYIFLVWMIHDLFHMFRVPADQCVCQNYRC